LQNQKDEEFAAVFVCLLNIFAKKIIMFALKTIFPWNIQNLTERKILIDRMRKYFTSAQTKSLQFLSLAKHIYIEVILLFHQPTNKD